MKKTLTVFLVVIVIAGLSYAGYKRFGPRPVSAAATLRTGQVTRGDLEITVAGASNIAAQNKWDVALSVAGKVVKVHIAPGQRVEAGQLLVELDTTDLEMDVTRARISLASVESQLAQLKTPATEAEIAAAQALLETARESLADLQAGSKTAAVAAAEASVASAQEKLDTLKAGPTAAQLATAEAAVKAAEETLSKLRTKPDTDAIQQAVAKVEQAKNSLWSTQSSRDSTCGAAAEGRGSTSACDSANASVANQEINVRLAEISYQEALKPASAVELANAAAQLKNAQDSLEKVQKGGSAAELAAAEAQLKSAQENLAELRSGASSARLATAQAQVAQALEKLERLVIGATDADLSSAENQVELNRLSLDKAIRQLENARLVAPISGTVTAVSVRVGDSVTANRVAATIVDLSKLELEVPLAETDVVRVAVGQEAKIMVDALMGVTLQGRVTYVSPVAVISQGVASFPVKVELVQGDPAVRAGMTAAVNIIIERRQDVLMVPNRALRTVGRERVVDVVSGDVVIQVPVQVGTSNASTTEIVAGALKEGDAVALNVTATTTAGQAGGFSVPGMGRLGGF